MNKPAPCSLFNQNDQMQYIEYLQCEDEQKQIKLQKEAADKKAKEAKKGKQVAQTKPLSEEETSQLVSLGMDIEVDPGIGYLSGKQDESDKPINKNNQVVAKSEIEGEASPYEMASMAEQGFASESTELPQNLTENSALMTDVSIADQSAALADMKEAHKEDMKTAMKVE